MVNINLQCLCILTSNSFISVISKLTYQRPCDYTQAYKNPRNIDKINGGKHIEEGIELHLTLPPLYLSY